jgi:hypothetical protein
VEKVAAAPLYILIGLFGFAVTLDKLRFLCGIALINSKFPLIPHLVILDFGEKASRWLDMARLQSQTEMRMNHLIAVYETVLDAERVCERLKEEDIDDRDIRLTRAPLAREPLFEREERRTPDPLLDPDMRSPAMADPALRDPTLGAPERAGLHEDQGEFDDEEREGWFYGWLRRASMPEAERDALIAHMTGTRAAVTVDIDDDRTRDRAVEIMEEGHPIDIEHDTLAAAPVAGGAALREPPHPASAAEAMPTAATTARGGTVPPTGGRTDRIEEGEQVIPVVKEDIAVGKRVSEQRYRVRAYTIDKPIEEKVMLRDEHVEIEHRPISGAAAGQTSELPKDREIEVVERHEEPVVEKRGTAAEEVVVRKEVRERPETVHGTVRETKIDVEKEPAGTETGVRGTEPKVGVEPAPGIKRDRRP